nr:Os02g0703700 [Ipomoea trifida]
MTLAVVSRAAKMTPMMLSAIWSSVRLSLAPMKDPSKSLWVSLFWRRVERIWARICASSRRAFMALWNRVPGSVDQSTFQGLEGGFSDGFHVGDDGFYGFRHECPEHKLPELGMPRVPGGRGSLMALKEKNLRTQRRRKMERNEANDTQKMDAIVNSMAEEECEFISSETVVG